MVAHPSYDFASTSWRNKSIPSPKLLTHNQLVSSLTTNSLVSVQGNKKMQYFNYGLNQQKGMINFVPKFQKNDLPNVDLSNNNMLHSKKKLENKKKQITSNGNIKSNFTAQKSSKNSMQRSAWLNSVLEQPKKSDKQNESSEYSLDTKEQSKSKKSVKVNLTKAASSNNQKVTEKIASITKQPTVVSNIKTAKKLKLNLNIQNSAQSKLVPMAQVISTKKKISANVNPSKGVTVNQVYDAFIDVDDKEAIRKYVKFYIFCIKVNLNKSF